MQLKTIRIAFFILLAMIVVACQEKDAVKQPETLLSEAQMINLLTDMQIIESDLNYRASLGETSIKRAKAYYTQLFEHYNITDSIFQDNINYYTQNTEVLQRITDSVFNRLSKEQRARQ